MKKDLFKEFNELFTTAVGGSLVYKGEEQGIVELGVRQFISKAISNAISQTRKEIEQARQEGYEVGYAQGEYGAGMPKSMVEFIKAEARKETLEEVEKKIERIRDDKGYALITIDYLIKLLNKLKSLKK